MSRSRRPRTGLWIATFDDGTSTRIVAKDSDQAFKRALRWIESKGSMRALIGLHEVI